MLQAYPYEWVRSNIQISALTIDDFLSLPVPPTQVLLTMLFVLCGLFITLAVSMITRPRDVHLSELALFIALVALGLVVTVWIPASSPLSIKSALNHLLSQAPQLVFVIFATTLVPALPRLIIPSQPTEQIEPLKHQLKQQLQSCKKSEEVLKLFVEHSPAAIAMFDRTMSYVWASQRWYTDYGLEDQNIIGQCHYDVFPEVPERWRDIHQHCLKGAQMRCEEDTFRRLDGSTEWIRWEIVPWTSEDCSIGGIIMFTEVITEQKLLQHQLSNIQKELEIEIEQRVGELKRLSYEFQFHIDNTPLAVIEWDNNLRISRWSSQAEKMFGWSAVEMLGELYTAWPFVSEDDRPDVNNTLRELKEKQISRIIRANRNYTKQGAVLECEWYYSALFDDEGELVSVLSFVQDVTHKKEARDALYKEKELAQITLRSIGDGVITTDAQGHITYLNPIAEQLTGWTTKEALHLPVAEVFNIIHETLREPVPNPVHQVITQKHITGLANHTNLVSRSGQEYPIEDSAAPILGYEGELIGVVLVFRDVTKSRELSNQLSWQAQHDMLTQLPNRLLFEKKVAAAIEDAHQQHSEHTLCYLDLDQFKIVNDTCGHAAGDELLRQIANLIQSAIRSGDVLARLGGDEFGLLLGHCSLNDAYSAAEKIRALIEKFRFIWHETTFSIGVSVGMVCICEQSQGLISIMSEADAACYAAKDQGRNQIHVYQSDDAVLTRQRSERQWTVRIREALDRDNFCLDAQTILPNNPCDAAKNCYEILLRMIDEDGRVVPPMAFLPAAERYGLMPQIDRWVVRAFFQHFRQPTSADMAGKPGFSQARYMLNLSGASICDRTFLEFLIQQFEQGPVPPEQICFEITETVAVANLYQASEFITQLKKLGCGFALDDFGSGMSSFGYLKNLPIDYIKIDGHFIRNILDNPVDSAIVKCIQDIGRTLGIKTIAEFVETPAIHSYLQTLDIDFVQGFGVGKPEPFLTVDFAGR